MDRLAACLEAMPLLQPSSSQATASPASPKVASRMSHGPAGLVQGGGSDQQHSDRPKSHPAAAVVQPGAGQHSSAVCEVLNGVCVSPGAGKSLLDGQAVGVQAASHLPLEAAPVRPCELSSTTAAAAGADGSGDAALTAAPPSGSSGPSVLQRLYQSPQASWLSGGPQVRHCHPG